MNTSVKIKRKNILVIWAVKKLPAMNNKIMSLAKILKAKLKRNKENLKDIEGLINDNTASNAQKQEYVRLKANIETLEDVIDLAEGMIEENNTE